jgi:hypothetical protein
MSNLLFLSDFREKSHRSRGSHRQQRVTFSRRELGQLLSVYSPRVTNGEWKDYAIDHTPCMAIFSIFRRTSEMPLYAIAKLATDTGRKGDYLLFSSGRIRHRAANIGDILALFDKRLRLINNGN